MTARFLLQASARACGFAAGWAVFTLVLLVATRPMGIGPGFSRPLPYAIAAILISCCGQLVRLWLHENIAHGPSGNAGKSGALRRFFREPLRGLGGFFRGTAAFNNFVFLSIAYILGIGLTSVFIRKEGSGKRPSVPVATYWKDLNLGKQDADAYYRPF